MLSAGTSIDSREFARGRLGSITNATLFAVVVSQSHPTNERQNSSATSRAMRCTVSVCATVTTDEDTRPVPSCDSSGCPQQSFTTSFRDSTTIRTGPQCPASSTRRSTRHRPHFLLSAVLRRSCCWAPAAVDRFVLPIGRSAANPPQQRWTDRRTDARPLHRPCPHTHTMQAASKINYIYTFSSHVHVGLLSSDS